MEFKKCQVGNAVFGHLNETDIANGVMEYPGMIQSSVDIVRDAL
jgi:hypothetical protein